MNLFCRNAESYIKPTRGAEVLIKVVHRECRVAAKMMKRVRNQKCGPIRHIVARGEGAFSREVEEAMKRAEESLANIDSSDNAEEVAAIQASISKSMAQLNLKRKRRRV